MNAIVERLPAAVWAATGGFVALASAAAVVPLVGGAEIAAGVAAALAGVGGIGAAWWRARLDALPLEFAPSLAVWEGPSGCQLTVRAWLGRGRRMHALKVEVVGPSGALPVVQPGVAVVGCFQAVFPAVDAPVTVRITGTSGGGSIVSERKFSLEERIPGRFEAGFSKGRAGWAWHRDRWPTIKPGRMR